MLSRFARPFLSALFALSLFGATANSASAQVSITGAVTVLRIDSTGNDNAARVRISGNPGCTGGFYNVSLRETTFPQMVAVLQTALVTQKPVTLEVTACQIVSVTISAI